MSQKIDEILEKMKHLENELREELSASQKELSYTIGKHRVYFEDAIITKHKREVEHIFRYLTRTPPRHLLSAPFIYSLIIPGMLLDFFVTLYQWICFPLYKIKKVKRSDYIAIDRQYLSYLNWIEKLNCVYCGYYNGLLAYVSEIAARSEQYWCPIKHANQTLSLHSKYKNFLDYGDAKGYKTERFKLRESLGKEEKKAL